jgi:hypothetical protein
MVKIVNSSELNTEEEVGRETGNGKDFHQSGLSCLPKSVYQVHILSYFDLKEVLRYRSISKTLSLTVLEVIEYEIVGQKAKLREFEEEMMRDNDLG